MIAYVHGRDLYACFESKGFRKPCNLECVTTIRVMLFIRLDIYRCF